MKNLSRIVLLVQLLLPPAFVAQSYAQSPGGVYLSDDPKAQGKPKRPLESLEIAPFARVMTCDPNRMEGAHSNRLEEFPAEDVFLEQELMPDAKGFYQVPVVSSQRSIGLSWPEKRLLSSLALVFRDPHEMPEPAKIQVQYWSRKKGVDENIYATTGSPWSPWQGIWQPLPGQCAKDGNRLVYKIDVDKVPEFDRRTSFTLGTHKIRWLFPSSGASCLVGPASAWSLNHSTFGKFRLELDQPRSGKQATLEMYNGYWEDGKSSGSSLTKQWDLGQPLIAMARYAVPLNKAERTLVRFEMPRDGFLEAGFSVALDDVLTSGGVYVRDFGVYVTPEPAPLSLAEYKRKIAGRQTTLDKVRRMPDQTFTRARKQLLNPLCGRDPMILSLACDNSKFLLQREGVLAYPMQGINGVFKYDAEIHPRFGSAPSKVDATQTRGAFYIDEKLERHLEEGWYPIPVITAREHGLTWRQRTFVAPFDKETSSGLPAWFNRKPLCVVEYTMENPGKDAAETSFSLRLVGVESLKGVERGVVVEKGKSLYAFIERGGADELRQTITGSLIEYRGMIPPTGKCRIVAYIPGWTVTPDDYATVATDVEGLASRTKDYWRRVIEGGTQIETPEAQLNDLMRASQVNCLLLAHNRQNGKLVESSAGSSIGPNDAFGNQSLNGLDLMGQGDFARRCLDDYLSRYNEKGFLTANYAIMGTAQNLWTLGQHYLLTRDAAWLRSIAPQLRKSCRWIVQQREKTKRLRPNGEKVPEYGLFTPQSTLCDTDRYTYYFYANAFYYAGLRLVASSLADIHDPAAEALLVEAKEFYQDIMRARRWNQARMPVWPLADGTWVPASPSELYCFGLIGDFNKGLFSHAHDVEYGGGHLVNLGLLSPQSPDAGWINDFLEDYWFFQPHASNYSAAVIKDDWYSHGGFSKIHPAQTRNIELSAARDDVKPFLRSYFNTIFPVLSSETLAFWEHIGFGDWNCVAIAGNFLRATRMMFVMERGNELWLAPFVTNQWMRDGMRVKIWNAPTNFGPVSYQIDSRVKDGTIQAEIDPPTRNATNALVIRLRHPEEKKMRRVTVNGQETHDFDPDREIIRLKPVSQRIVIRAFY